MFKSKILLVVLLVAAFGCNPENKELPSPTIYFAGEGKYEISLSDTLELSPKITYDNNSSYRWTVDNKIVGTDKDLTFIPPRLADFNLTFSVENAQGSDSYDVSVSVVKGVTGDSFENFKVPSASGLYIMPDSLLGFIADSVTFSNELNADTTMWFGFAFSNRTSIASTVSTAAIGCAYIVNGKSSNYMAVSGYGPSAYIDFAGKSYTPKSIDVTNDNFVYLVSKFGYVDEEGGISLSYSTYGDYFKMQIVGLDEGGNWVSSLDVDLIDCNFDNPAKYVRVSAWETIDLTPLGRVSGLYFHFLSSQRNFPPFACVDNLKLQD